jgi:hypothetical protein
MVHTHAHTVHIIEFSCKEYLRVCDYIFPFLSLTRHINVSCNCIFSTLYGPIGHVAALIDVGGRRFRWNSSCNPPGRKENERRVEPAGCALNNPPLKKKQCNLWQLKPGGVHVCVCVLLFNVRGCVHRQAFMCVLVRATNPSYLF